MILRTKREYAIQAKKIVNETYVGVLLLLLTYGYISTINFGISLIFLVLAIFMLSLLYKMSGLTYEQYKALEWTND